tara:strand:- start:222 stop:530 length:309 start_codon:yes stop_codon:yes gene_type:complete
MAVITLFLVVFSSSVQSQQAPLICQPYSIILETLNEKYGEHVTAHAINSNGKIVRFFRNSKTKTWTVIVSLTNDVSCIVGSGQNMEIPGIDEKRCVSAVNET